MGSTVLTTPSKWCQLAGLNSSVVWGLSPVTAREATCWVVSENKAAGTGGRDAAAAVSAGVTSTGGVTAAGVTTAGGATAAGGATTAGLTAAGGAASCGSVWAAGLGWAAVRGRPVRLTLGSGPVVMRALVMNGARAACRRSVFWALRSISYC